MSTVTPEFIASLKTMVLESTARYIGPGHAAIMNDNGTNWFTYHYYDAKNNGAPTVGMNRIYWSADGWPKDGLNSSPDHSTQPI